MCVVAALANAIGIEVESPECASRSVAGLVTIARAAGIALLISFKWFTLHQVFSLSFLIFIDRINFKQNDFSY